MADARTEAELVARAQAGDRDAFATLVGRYQQPIGGYVWRLTGDRELAQDLTQETFLHAFRAIRSTQPDLLLSPWLYRIATNLVYDYFRRRRRFGLLPLPIAEPGPDLGDWTGVEQTDAVWRALASLTSRERAVLLLCALEGYSYRETGLILGISSEAVRKQFGRAKERFRQAYTAQTGGGRAEPAPGGGGLRGLMAFLELAVMRFGGDAAAS